MKGCFFAIYEREGMTEDMPFDWQNAAAPVLPAQPHIAQEPKGDTPVISPPKEKSVSDKTPSKGKAGCKCTVM